mgnify:CR=1 FL=1
MLFKTLNGRERNVSVNRYRVDWEREKEVSGPQGKVKKFLRPYWEGKMVLEEFRVPSTRLRLDLYDVSDGIVVEVSPAATHTMYNPFMHGSLSGYRNTIKRDLLKEDWCRLNGLTLVTLIDEDIANLSAALFLERFGVTL